MRDDEASTVMPFAQMIPIFGFILGYFILGEILNTKQLFACLIVIIGIAILSLNLADGKIKIKKKIILLMLTWAFLFAVSDIIFKFITINEGNYWTSLFWEFMEEYFWG